MNALVGCGASGSIGDVLDLTTRGWIAGLLGTRVAGVWAGYGVATATGAGLTSRIRRTQAAIVTRGAVGTIDQLTLAGVAYRILALNRDGGAFGIFGARTGRRVPFADAGAGGVTGVVFGAVVAVVTGAAFGRCGHASSIGADAHIAIVCIRTCHWGAGALASRTDVGFGAGVGVVAIRVIGGVDQRALAVLTNRLFTGGTRRAIRR